MNKIICDIETCKAEIPMTKDIIETKYLSEGIQIRFFRCKTCGDKTLIDVTDREIRSKVIELRKWAEQHENVMNVNLDGLSKEEFNKLALLLNETEFNSIRLKDEIKAAKAELKAKYEGDYSGKSL